MMRCSSSLYGPADTFTSAKKVIICRPYHLFVSRITQKVVEEYNNFWSGGMCDYSNKQY